MKNLLLLAASSGLRHLGARIWSGWPEEAYQRESYRQRLGEVQKHLGLSLDAAPTGSLRILSICAGDGRDVIGVLRVHQRRGDITAWLVELNRRSVAAGIRAASIARLENSGRFLNEDATLCRTYQNIGPSDIVLVCGVWGHVPPHERGRLVQGLASLCKPGAAVIWTRGVSQGMVRLQEIQVRFASPSWEQVRVSLTPDQRWAVATNCFRGSPIDAARSGQFFQFERRAG